MRRTLWLASNFKYCGWNSLSRLTVSCRSHLVGALAVLGELWQPEEGLHPRLCKAPAAAPPWPAYSARTPVRPRLTKKLRDLHIAISFARCQQFECKRRVVSWSSSPSAMHRQFTRGNTKFVCMVEFNLIRRDFARGHAR